MMSRLPNCGVSWESTPHQEADLQRRDKNCPTRLLSDPPAVQNTITHDSEPREREIDAVVQDLHGEGELAAPAMAGAKDLAGMCDGVRRREERAVEPPPTLRDELGKLIWHVRMRDRPVDVFEDPRKVEYEMRDRGKARTKRSWPWQRVRNIEYANNDFSMRPTDGRMSHASSARYMLLVKMSVSRPCRTSPLKYEASGPIPRSSFCRAMYLENTSAYRPPFIAQENYL
jgi:hypothetical protein